MKCIAFRYPVLRNDVFIYEDRGMSSCLRGQTTTPVNRQLFKIVGTL